MPLDPNESAPSLEIGHFFEGPPVWRACFFCRWYWKYVVDLHEDAVRNSKLGAAFEYLIRRIADVLNERVGEASLAPGGFP